MKDWQEIKDALGQGDEEPEVLGLKLAARGWRLDSKGVLEALETTAAHCGARDDCREFKWGMFVKAYGGSRPFPMFYHSGYVFRNLCRLMFRTSLLDDAVLAPEFIDGLAALAERAKAASLPGRQIGGLSWDMKKLDLVEIVLEFQDRLAEKARTYSGA